MSGRAQGTGRRAWAAGFTLIEILIAVLILALGLLGLGAVFPVVIRQQRIGVEATYGVMAANSAQALLTGTDLNSGLANPATHNLWREWRDNPPLSQAAFDHGQWFIPATDNVTNATELGRPGTVSAFWLPVRARLYPYDPANGEPPELVWDVAVHRVVDDDNLLVPRGFNPFTNDTLQVAVFVRRIDPRIRVPANTTLLQVIADNTLSANKRRRPVAVDLLAGLPTLSGEGNYGTPRTVTVQFDYVPNDPTRRDRDRLLVQTPNAALWALVRQVGQRLVDNLGNVYTVVGSAEQGSNRVVKVDPPVPAYVNGPSAPTITEVVFTPQVPAAVHLFKIKPKAVP